MEFKFSKDGEENSKSVPAVETKNQRALLVLLLLLVGGFSYVYLFTGIIRPQEALKSPEVPANQLVKMPLPPRDGDAGKAGSKSPDTKREAALPPKAEPPKIAQPAPVAVVAPAAKTQTQPTAKAKQEAKKNEAALSVEKKPAVVGKKSEPAKAGVKKISAVAAAKPKAPSKSEKPVQGVAESTDSASAWSVIVGTYLLEDALSTDMGRVRKAGFVPVVNPGARKKSEMNRLFLSEFTDPSAANAAFNKLKRHTSDAFILEQAGKYNVYAGSYLLDARASFEMERLSAAGFPVVLKRAEVAIPSQDLTLGPFKNRKAADEALGKLKAAGIKATLYRQ
jgi:cell division septation protein DedD